MGKTTGFKHATVACKVAAMLVCLPLPAQAQIAAAPPTSHPIYVSVPDAALDGSTYATFSAAVAKVSLGPVQTADLPEEPAPQAAKKLSAAVARFKDLAFDEARQLLAPALEEAAVTGAAGLSQEALCDLHLYLAMALDRADWRDLPQGGPAAPSVQASDAYLQSAALCPQRQLYQRTFPPLALIRHAAAVAETKRRGEGLLIVRAASDALVSVDGRAAVGGPVSLTLPYGEHFIRVERPGRVAWVNKVPLTLSKLEIDVPDQNFRTFPDDEAATHARRMGAAYALVAELKPGTPTQLELRLVEVASSRRIDSTRVALGAEVGGVHAAVMRLDEEARRRDLLAQEGHSGTGLDAALVMGPAPTKAIGPEHDPTNDPVGWAQTRWPVLVAVGVVLTTTLVLGLAVALDDKMAEQ